MADMKWYIFREEDDHHVPLCWAENGECPCCEFDTKEDAVAFVEALKVIPFLDPAFITDAEIRNCIFYYDDGKRNMSGFIPVANGDDIELKEVANEEI